MVSLSIRAKKLFTFWMKRRISSTSMMDCSHSDNNDGLIKARVSNWIDGHPVYFLSHRLMPYNKNYCYYIFFLPKNIVLKDIFIHSLQTFRFFFYFVDSMDGLRRILWFRLRPDLYFWSWASAHCWLDAFIMGSLMLMMNRTRQSI